MSLDRELEPVMRAYKPAFRPEQIGWIDFETRSKTTIKAGAPRYMCDADAIVLAYAIGDAPARVVAAIGADPLSWDDMPEDFWAHHAEVERGAAIWCAWNAAFDRYAWTYATADFPE